jgi:GT2 family glycosyltransferase
MQSNPWLPWTPTERLDATSRVEQVLVIIPTAGNDLDRLRRCLDSVRHAAGPIKLHPVVVLSPSSVKKVRALKTACRGRASVLPLPGAFNYCRSVNEGLAQRRPEDTCALLINDDVTLTGKDDLATLVHTLRQQHWACTGPYVADWHNRHSAVPRQHGPVRTNEPVNGCCVLWDLQWLDRIGGLDEEFGRGWGLDEADACLRALRRGAQFGREDRVMVFHRGHGTFGADYTALEGPAHERNVRLFARKFGPDVGPWGQTHHWWPLPGVQVSIAAHNAARWLKRCLASVEQAMDGYRWSLVIGDDCSSDTTFEIASAHQHNTSADVCLIKRFQRKAMTVDQAKNRVIRMGAPLRGQYPAMCLMDADDEMAPGRLRHLLWRARDGGHLAVLGDFQQVAPDHPGQDGRVIRATAESQIHAGFGPWATLFHAKLVPRDNRLFREHRRQISHGDVDLWVRWYLRGIHFKPFPGEVVHRYYWHPGTASRPLDEKLANWAREIWRRRKSRLLGVPLDWHVSRAYSQSQLYSQPQTAGLDSAWQNRRLFARAYSQPQIVAM